MARDYAIAFSYVASHGKGSHGAIYYGDGQATISDLKKELPKGTQRAILKQLGIEHNG